jgi:hypothetical protein
LVSTPTSFGLVDRRVVLIVVAIGVLLRLPTIFSGYALDDYGQLAMVEGVYPVGRSALDLFTFSSGEPQEVQHLMDRGGLPWWSDAKLRLSAMRPLSSALLWVDWKLFGAAALPRHLHSVGWWVVLLLAAASLFFRLLPRRAAALAFALYVLDGCHTNPLGWVAARNATVAASLGVLGLLWHLRWRAGWRAGRPLSIVFFVLALAAGEYALGALSYVVAHELVGRGGPGRLRAAAPAAVLALAYVVMHATLGYGAYGSEVYLDPLRQPGAYLQAAPERAAALFADLTAGIPAGQILPWPAAKIAIGLVGLALLLALAPAGWRAAEAEDRRHLKWLALGALLAVVPALASFPAERLLLLPTIGLCAWVAAILAGAVARARSAAVAARGRWLHATAGFAVALVHFVVGPAWAEIGLLRLVEHERGVAAAIAASDMPDDAKRRFVLLSGVDLTTTLYAPMIRHLGGAPLPRSWWVLSLAPHSHRITRVDEQTLELEVLGPALLQGPLERLFRRRSVALGVGDSVALDGLVVTVIRSNGLGPTHVRYAFDRSLEDPSLTLLVTEPDGLRIYPPPAIGRSAILPPPWVPLRTPG